MSTSEHLSRGVSDHTGWSDSAARSVLQLMAESVAEMVGFEITALSVVLDDELVTIAYSGPEEYRAYLEESDPVDLLDPVLERAVAWGPRMRFLAAEDHGELPGHWVEFEQKHVDHPDAWRPEDVLLAVLCDDAGSVVGIISVDRPVSGLRPDDKQRRLLERYAAQAERAVLNAFEREELLQQIAHADNARRLIRAASMPAHPSLEAVLRSTHRPLVEGFRATGSWIHVLDAEAASGSYARGYAGDPVAIDPGLLHEAEILAPRLWRDEAVLVINAGESSGVPQTVHDRLRDLGQASLLGVPLGAGTECVGFLALSRGEQDAPWSPVEIDSARQIGHDLGAALMTVRALENERRLVRELQQLDDYRSQLIATMSHELRTPLTVISGNLELLDDLGLELESAAARLYAAMTRGAERMKKVVDDVLLLALVSNPQHPLVPSPVDLREVASDVLALVRADAGSRRLTLDADPPPTGLVVPGDPAEIYRLVGNLVSNAVKYTPDGGTVAVSLKRGANDVVLEVSDDGMGISEQDQVGLFGAFFRTSNPDALALPGAGLGLAIVATIVERHQGLVGVTSRLGEGTTFRVSLPLAHADRESASEVGLVAPRRPSA